MVARSRARRKGAESDPSLGIPHPCTLGAAGMRGPYELAGWRWFWGSAQPPVGGAPRGRSSKDPHPQRTHTLVGRPARLTQALPAPRGRPEGQSTDICTRIHTSVHMCTQTYLPHTSAHWGTVTSSESASASARSAARTQPAALASNGLQPGVTFGHTKHNPVFSCRNITATVCQMTTQNLVLHTHIPLRNTP